MSAPKNILIAGSSGMVGNELVQICMESKEINKIYLLSRNPTQHKNQKVQEIVINNFLDYNILILFLHQYRSQFQHYPLFYKLLLSRQIVF